jgi:hypothetical protein
MQVKVIARKGQAVLVEWTDEAGHLRRSVLPVNALHDGPDGAAHGAEADRPEEGIPYGLPWEALVTFQATPDALADALRRNGIWTYADLVAKPNEAMAAFRTVYGFDAQALRAAARTLQEV